MSLYSFGNTRPTLHKTAFIAPSAQLIGDIHIGKYSSVWFQSVLRGDFERIVIGDRTNIQDLSVCHADPDFPLLIGSCVTIGHHAMVHGCTIEDECLIGMGTTILNGTIIGKGSVIAAGTVVLEKTIIPPYSLVTGMPGKIKKVYENNDKLKASILSMSDAYVKKAQDYCSEKIFREIKT
jgi:carbonic anhydrase/acetyltransferase-like protein (isoleucine patch superfamily)